MTEEELDRIKICDKVILIDDRGAIKFYCAKFSVLTVNKKERCWLVFIELDDDSAVWLYHRFEIYNPKDCPEYLKL